MADTIENWSVRTERGRKGRTFPLTGMGLLARTGRYSEAQRPTWAAFACEEGALRPILANILGGLRIERGGYSGSSSLEFPRSFGYVSRAQRLGDGVAVATVYIPSFFTLDPGLVDARNDVAFVALPDAGWSERSLLTPTDCRRAAEDVLSAGLPSDAPMWLPRTVEGLAQLVPLAVLVAAYLDRRTRCPLMDTPGFSLLLAIHLLSSGCGAWLGGERYVRGSRSADGMEWWCDPGLRYCDPFVVQASAKSVEAVIANTVAAYIPGE